MVLPSTMRWCPEISTGFSNSVRAALGSFRASRRTTPGLPVRLIARPLRGRIAHTQVARHAEEDFSLAKWFKSEVIKACALHVTLRSISKRGYGGDLYLRPAVQLANPLCRFRATQLR